MLMPLPKLIGHIGVGRQVANIFFPDLPSWEKAIEGVQMGILFNQGQVCCAGSRVFVHEEIYDKFLADCVKAFNNVKVGLPWEKDTVMGAQVNESQLKKILAYVEVGEKEGAKVACGGKRLTANGLDKGCFMEPTILADVDNKMRVAQEEIFGPGLAHQVQRWGEVIKMANDSEYGLRWCCLGQDINKALRVLGQWRQAGCGSTTTTTCLLMHRLAATKVSISQETPHDARPLYTEEEHLH